MVVVICPSLQRVINDENRQQFPLKLEEHTISFDLMTQDMIYLQQTRC